MRIDCKDYLLQPYCTEEIIWCKIVQNILDDISVNGLFEFSETQTLGNSKEVEKTRALKTFKMNSFCVRKITGFMLAVAIIVKCEENIFLAQKNGESKWQKNLKEKIATQILPTLAV